MKSRSSWVTCFRICRGRLQLGMQCRMMFFLIYTTRVFTWTIQRDMSVAQAVKTSFMFLHKFTTLSWTFVNECRTEIDVMARLAQRTERQRAD